MAKSLRLTAASYDGEPRSGLSRRVGPGRFAIGRGGGNDWVLADPKKHVSNRHCIIEEHDGQYSITDFSANGVFVNGADQALGHGCSALLNDGDRIAIGDYQIAVEVETVSSDLASSPGFGGIGSVPVDAVPGSSMDEPFPLRIEPLPPQQPTPDAVAPWLGEKPVGHLEDCTPAAAFSPEFAEPEPSRRRAPDPDHLPSVNEFFRIPEIKPSIIPADWNALEAGNDFAEVGAAVRQASDCEAPQLPQPAPIAGGAREEKPGAAEEILQAPAGEVAGQALRAFLRGSGLSDAEIVSVDALACLQRYGELLRELSSGIRELLAARALMKSEFRIPQTIIRPSGNNPFKFSVDLEQALQALLLPKSNGYADPLTAVREAIADLRAHEVGMIAGMHQAAAKLLGALAPATLESRIEAAGLLASLVPAARKARCWEAYETAYQEVAADLEEDLRGAFREAFAAAYTEQVKKL